jgi:site-specific DNA recombinase
MPAVIYARQSLDRDGQGAAVDRQLQECRDLAARQGLTVDTEYVDNDVSASKGSRPAFTELLSRIELGQVDTIITWHTDRLYRRVRDLVSIVDVAEKHALKILTVSAGDLDLGTPAGRMLAGMLGHAARYEVEQKGERQILANQKRAAAGVWQFSNRPYGYERVDGKVSIVPAEADVLREAYRRYLAGETYYAIAQDLNARAIPTIKSNAWTVTQLRARLNNPAYAGIRMYRGEVVGEGDWEPIIDRATWEQFNAASTTRGSKHDWSNRTKYLLSGLARCGVCGSRMFARPEYSRPNAEGIKRSRMTYQCIEKWCVARDLSRVDAVVEERVIERLSRPDAADLLSPPVDVQPLVARAQELRTRRDDLASLLAEGLLTAQAVRDESRKIQAQLTELDDRVVRATGGTGMSAFIESTDLLAYWRDEMTLPQRRLIISAGITVTINKQANTRRFDPDDVVTEWVV